MQIIDVNEFRDMTRQLIPTIELDSPFTFFYDETNNIRKFHVKEDGFNSPFQSNFVLGGLVYEGEAPNVEKLFVELNLQKSVKDVKLQHLAKGDFLSCLKSKRLNLFLRYLLEHDIYIHYSNINILYYSLVDIVDSAISNSEPAIRLGPEFSRFLKDNLYKLSKLEIDSVTEIFYEFGYPNIKKESISSFIASLTRLFEGYEDEFEFHIGLTSLKQILRASEKDGTLPFLEAEDDFVLIKEFSQFYMRPIYLFKNSIHVFDNEKSIESILNDITFKDGEKTLNTYTFEDSNDNLFIQASDVLVGLVGKLSSIINTSSPNEIEDMFTRMGSYQLETLDLYLDLVNVSDKKNFAFFHVVDSIDEVSKLRLIHELRGK